jgi:chromosomal replication initiation ATPase DnaA
VEGAVIELRSRKLESIGQIKRLVAKRYGLTVGELENGSRERRYSWPRQVALALCVKRLRPKGYTLTRIAQGFPGESKFAIHHTTVLWAAKKWGVPIDPVQQARGRRAYDAWQGRAA